MSSLIDAVQALYTNAHGVQVSDDDLPENLRANKDLFNDDFDADPVVNPSEPHKITDAKLALKFMLAGNAYFTVRSTKTGIRYTFRVSKAKDDQNSERWHGANYVETYFVSMLSSSNNENDYSYMGIIRDKKFSVTKRSRFAFDSTPVQAFKWMFERLLLDHMPTTVELWHEGRCGRCGRKLTVPESIEAGIGPECATRLQ